VDGTGPVCQGDNVVSDGESIRSITVKMRRPDGSMRSRPCEGTRHGDGGAHAEVVMPMRISRGGHAEAAVVMRRRPRPCEGTRRGCGGAAVFFALSCSHVAYLDYCGVPFRPLPRRCPRDGGTLQAFLCPPPRRAVQLCTWEDWRESETSLYI
jgi:hypothetical protein